MSNETFLISIRQNNDLSDVAVAELRADLAKYPLHQRLYTDIAALAGNSRQYGIKQMSLNLQSNLLKKQILFLGSSVTFGLGALGESFVDYLWKKDGVAAIKNAENGTTLVDQAANSYVARFNQELQEEAPDALVLQLSTNDAQRKYALGKVTNDNIFDTQTVIGALEYIIYHAQKSWHCPILLYTNPYFANSYYAKMVQACYQLKDKYQISVLDLYQNPNFQQQDQLYMADAVHPTRAGYKLKWLPLFEQELNILLKNKD